MQHDLAHAVTRHGCLKRRSSKRRNLVDVVAIDGAPTLGVRGWGRNGSALFRRQRTAVLEDASRQLRPDQRQRARNRVETALSLIRATTR